MGIAVEAVWESGVLTPQTRLDLPEKARVRITIEPPQSKLGEDLRAIRARIEASGIPLLSKEEILQEIHERRGGYTERDE